MKKVKYKYQSLFIPSDWIVRRNEFYDIDPKGIAPEEHNFSNIYCQEDLLLIEKGRYHLDLG